MASARRRVSDSKAGHSTSLMLKRYETMCHVCNQIRQAIQQVMTSTWVSIGNSINVATEPLQVYDSASVRIFRVQSRQIVKWSTGSNMYRKRQIQLRSKGRVFRFLLVGDGGSAQMCAAKSTVFPFDKRQKSRRVAKLTWRTQTRAFLTFTHGTLDRCLLSSQAYSSTAGNIYSHSRLG